MLFDFQSYRSDKNVTNLTFSGEKITVVFNRKLMNLRLNKRSKESKLFYIKGD